MHPDVSGLIKLLRRVQDEGAGGRAPVDIVAEWRGDHKKVIDFTDAAFFDLELEDVDFSNLDMSGANFGSPVGGLTNVAGAKFRGTRIDRVTFINCELRGAEFSTNESKSGVVRDDGVSTLFDCCNLNNARFVGIRLKRVAFAGCSLKDVNFRNALFVRCEWIERQGEGNAEAADFVKATLENCRICRDCSSEIGFW
jgi:uncharacterized protein YjbI with pentapeptide repeats